MDEKKPSERRRFSLRKGGDAKKGIEDENNSDIVTVKKRNVQADDDIFALGDAAQELGDLDDIFSGLGMGLNSLIADGQLAPVAAGNGDTTKVYNFSKTDPSGKVTKGRVIQGPVKCVKRIVKISRETPNGMEVIAEIEAEPDEDVTKVISQYKQLGKRNTGSYDNFDLERGDTNDAELKTQVLAVTAGDDGRERIIDETALDSGTGSNGRQQGYSSPEHQPLLESNGGDAPKSPYRDVNRLPPRHPSLGETDPHGIISRSDSIQSNHIGTGEEHRGSIKHDPDHDPYEYEATYEKYQSWEDGYSNDPRYECDVCCLTIDCKPCLPCLGPSRAAADKKRWKPKKNAKRGMTCSAVSTDSNALPGVKSLVANYAKMLFEDRDQFVETMFRAVKLNKLDVIRILCKIVQKANIKLSHDSLREPESSATILHVALLYNHKEIVDFLLLLKEPDLILAKYETSEYHNQTGLHVAVANGDIDVVEKLLLALQVSERQVLINTIADGHYFRTKHPYGQMCLTAAAWAGHSDVIKLLVKHGGNLALRNYTGNTLMHTIVQQSAWAPEKHDYPDLWATLWDACYIKAESLTYDTKNAQQKELHQRHMQATIFKELISIRNDDGYTSLALATIESSSLLLTMLNMEKIFKIPQNKLGSIAWVTYDVTDITSFARHKYDKFSVLHLLAHNSASLSRHASDANDEIDFLELEPIKSVVELKWTTYRWVYIFWFILHFSYMVVFTACTVSVNSSPLFTKGEVSSGHNFDVQWGLATFILLPIVYIVLEIFDLFGNRPYRIQLMKNQNFLIRVAKCVKSEWTITGNGPYRAVCLGFSCFTLQWFLLYASKDSNQDIGLAMSLLLGWIFCLFFTRGCRVTCRFSIMIQKMFFRDLMYFLTVYGIILIAFSFAINSLFTYLAQPELSLNKVFYDMMNVITDLDEKQSTEQSRHPMFAKLLLILYAIMAVILLMNMLIAMMNTSYETVRVTRCNLWKQQQLSIMLMIERRLFFWTWLIKRSENTIFSEETDDEMRSFIDVTMLHSSRRSNW